MIRDLEVWLRKYGIFILITHGIIRDFEGWFRKKGGKLNILGSINHSEGDYNF